jgi:hypothetical protein
MRSDDGGRGLLIGALAATLAVHLWVTTGMIAPASLLTPEPFTGDDYALHAGRAAIVAAELPRTGRLWVYDPTIMAGYPLGATVFDLDNVGIAAWMALLEPLGAGRAFKLGVWLCLVLAPLGIFVGARRLGAAADEAVAAAAATTVIAASAITFRLGMFANFAVAYLAVLVVALAARHLDQPRLGSFLALVGVGTLGLWLHVFLGILVLVPCAVLVALHARRTPARTLLHAVLIAAALVALSAPWLVPFLRFSPVLGWDYPHHFFQTGPLATAWRALTALAGWPLLLLGLGGVGFLGWAGRVGRPLAAAYGVWIAVLLAAALQGSRIPFVGRFEPAHLIQPASFALAPLAGMGAVRLVRAGLAGLGWPPALAVVLAPLLFVPHLLAARAATAPLPPIATLPPAATAFVDWLQSRTEPGARVLLEDRLHLERPRLDRDVADHPFFGGHLLTMLPALIDRETIGGPYPEMPISPHRADLRSAVFFGEPLEAWTPEAFAAQLERYNIGWIVVWSTPARRYLEAQPALVEPLGRFGPFHAFRRRGAASWVLEGEAQVTARPNAIEVRDASPGRVVLKYHWYPGFCSDPPLPVGPYEAPELAAPFIAVENGGQREFVLHPTRGWRDGCGAAPPTASTAR